MSFSTISTFSSLKFPTTGIIINYVYPNVDSSMSIYYTFNFSSGNYIPNYKSGTTVYDATIIGNGVIDNTNTTNNYIMGNGALKLTNTTNTVATQYVQTTTSINTTNNNNCLSISVWFNPSNLSANNLYTLFDIIGNVGSSGIQIDLSGINSICYGYYDTITTTNLFFNNIDNSMSIIYYPFNNAINQTLPNYSQSNVVYDGNIIGDATITNNTANYIIGNGALKLVNSMNNTATQYVRNNTSISGISEITISIWFNPSTSLSANGFYTLFDIAGNSGSKGIQLDLSGTNTICSELFY